MTQVINTILPVFGLIGLGFIMVRRGLFSQNGVNDIVRFVFYLAVPSLLFRTAASGVMQQPLELNVLIAFFGTAITLFFVLHFCLRKLGKERAIVAAMSGVFSNLVLIGLPIVQTAYPPDALVPLMTLITFNAMILFTLPCVLMENVRSDNVKLYAMGLNALLSALKNPIVIGLMCGLTLSFSGIETPYVVDRITALLAAAATPCALFAVGGGMANYAMKVDDTTAPVIITALFKLILFPVSVWLCCTFILHTSPLWTMIVTFAAALPTGANPFIFATKYQTGERLSGNTILLTTSLSAITLSLFLLLFPAP